MAFSFERKILKSFDLQEQVRIYDIIMSCHLFGSEKKIIIMIIKKKQPNSILFLQWAICLPSNLSLAQHLQKGEHLQGWRRNASDIKGYQDRVTLGSPGSLTD